MTNRVITINGIGNTGKANVDKIGKALASDNWIWRDPWYKKIGPFRARFMGERLARTMAWGIHENDTVVCHSFGSVVGLHLSNIVPFKNLILIAPAAPEDWDFSNANVQNITCFHSEQDRAVRIGSMLPFHVFGKAGLTGMNSSLVKNIETQNTHGSYFHGEELDKILKVIKNA